LGDIKNFTCLDPFGGSGSLGFEAASRGCKLSIILEENNKNFFYLKKNLERIKIKNLKLFNCSFFYYLNNFKFNFYDLIFIDSPYIIFKNLINFIEKSLDILNYGSLIYIETIFNVNLIFNYFKYKILVLKNDFF